MIAIYNPATGEQVTRLETHSSEQIAEMWKYARGAQRGWVAISLSERCKRVEAFLGVLKDREEELVQTLTQETGKPLWQSKNELAGAQARIRWMIDHAEAAFAASKTVVEPQLIERVERVPLGVIANISAWNYPYLVGINVFVAAILAGNAVLYKPSEYALQTGLAIEAAWREADLPVGIFQTIVGDAAAGEALLDLPLDGYFFTGSYKTGRYIAGRVAEKLVPVQLELGGKDPLYVSADNANIPAVAEAAAEGTFYNAGQSCCAVERIYVHADVYDDFVEAFVESAKTWRVGDPTEEQTRMGPLARFDQLELLEHQYEDALAKGARCIFRGNVPQSAGFYYPPTVLVSVHHDMAVMREESFGPIIGIQRVASDAEALELMADTEYGLTAAVYADHLTTAEPILSGLDVGTAYWNCCDRVSPASPWSGRGHSGLGATLGLEGMRTFTRPRAWHLKKV